MLKQLRHFLVPVLFWVVGLVYISPLHGAVTFQTPAVFGYSAKSVGLGAVDISNRASSSVFENASLLALSAPNNLELFYVPSVMDDLPYTSLAFGWQPDPGLTFAFGYLSAGSADLSRTSLDSDGEAVAGESFGFSDSEGSFGLRVRVTDALDLGGSIVGYFRSLDTISATGFSGNLSATYQMAPYLLSASIQHVSGRSIKYSNGAVETLPLLFTFSLSAPVFTDFTAFFQLTGRSADSFSFTKSAALSWTPFSVKEMAILFGYKERFQPLTSKVSPVLSLGFLASFEIMELQYAYERSPYFGSPAQNFLSISINY